MRNIRQTSRHQGMTFIEVLIALFLLLVGLLGAVAMQATVKKSSFDAMQRSLASSLAQDMLERMRSNDPTALATYESNDYGVALNAVPANRCNIQGAPCTAAQMATNDIYEWELALMGADVMSGGDRRGGLIGARGCVSHNANAVQVVVSWQGRVSTVDGQKVNNCGAASDKRRQVVVEAFIN
ncbi:MULTISPECIES: type IV pilus modification protein PilV [Thalassotalea]|uniref:type IV pilus modification protein PilV n=1 Tax=Thalassotalea TaxID=1518149 RepID=UPI000945B45F|nr:MULTISPECIES: type IV pilus modification protein PilV [Thalassotalea]OKY25756.1 type IV pilus modification protein PilV [Thalassotalea sp. PP2-459]